MDRCPGCGSWLHQGEACFECEVVAAQRCVCADADDDCWSRCENAAGCVSIFMGATTSTHSAAV
ncbi:hypothetical protein [Tessaracoccus lacteus]|uniref:Uncharacterized protein n=1 Tax=Tessaracoccus lacteus TaxID=3041766 RepID=A0ABY8PVE4_9ACTN|nr:hypothetical protein [Tessaracoccus sp. T21]WGT46427.1 hypothetical protein QH948_09740 [Tessaracoccus sp. T21]